MVLQNISLSVKDEFKLVCSVHGEGKLRWVDVYVCVHVRTCVLFCRAVDLLTRTSEELLVSAVLSVIGTLGKLLNFNPCAYVLTPLV